MGDGALEYRNGAMIEKVERRRWHEYSAVEIKQRFTPTIDHKAKDTADKSIIEQ